MVPSFNSGISLSDLARVQPGSFLRRPVNSPGFPGDGGYSGAQPPAWQPPQQPPSFGAPPQPQPSPIWGGQPPVWGGMPGFGGMPGGMPGGIPGGGDPGSFLRRRIGLPFGGGFPGGGGGPMPGAGVDFSQVDLSQLLGRSGMRPAMGMSY